MNFCFRLIGRCDRLIGAIVLVATQLIGLSLPVLAETRQVQAVISPTREHTYTQMMQEAESEATQLVTQAFGESRSITNVAVIIWGERNGQQIPLLSATISRVNWKKTSRIQAWAKYFGNASVALLGFARSPRQPEPVAPAATTFTPPNPSSPTPTSPIAQSVPEIARNPSVSPTTPVIPTAPPTRPGFTPNRIRLPDDPGFRDD